jgi:hypothetical protein
MIPPTPESEMADSPTPPLDANHEAKQEAEVVPAPPQKRKAGRKPLYKTAQERRDRNRRAQLAFRARRSDYLAKLEETCRSLENVVIELQESNRVTNDALAHERMKVRVLERMLQNNSPANMATQPPIYASSATAMTIPSTERRRVARPSAAVQGHFSSQQSTHTHHQSVNSMLLFPENSNFLGMLPLPMIELRVLDSWCRSVIGISLPTKPK